MSGIERYKKLHELQTGSPEQLRELAWAIPMLFRFSEYVMSDKSLYNAEFPNFCHRFCGGEEYRPVVGKLLELWESGVYRDGDCFFFGGSGNLNRCLVNGVNVSTGDACEVDVTPFGMLVAEEGIKRLTPRPDLELEPGRHSMPLANCMYAMEYMAQGGEEEYNLPEVVPSFVRRMGRAGRMPVMPKLEFTRVPAGEFFMGRMNSPLHRCQKPFSGERLEVPSFEMMPFQVTRETWAALTGESPDGEGQPQSPVTHVSWHDCDAFARILTGMDRDYAYSLPTEVQWEYACRAGGSSDYPWGDEPRSPEAGEEHSLGKCEPNNWELSGMRGGVAEWCLDRFSANPCSSGSVNNSVPTPGLRVVRGGDEPFWQSSGMVPWYRDSVAGVLRRFGVGFRLVRTRKS